MADADLNINIKTTPADPLGKVNAKLKETDKEVEKLEGSFAKLANGSISSIAKIGGALVGLSALKEGFGFILDSTREMEDLTTQFIAFTGSAESAAAQLEKLSQFASESPFQLAEIANANRTLLAFGSSTGKSLEQLRQLSEVAAATGTSLSELATIFGQVQAAGKLTGERFNQLVERGVNIGPVLAKSLGVAESSLEKLRSEGKISADEVAKAFEKMTSAGGQFFGSTERLSKTVSGSLSTLSDNFKILASTIGTSGVPAFSALVNIISKAVEGNIAYLKEQQKIANENGAQKRIRAIGVEVEKLTGNLNDLKEQQAGGFGFLHDDALKVASDIDIVTTALDKLKLERLKLVKGEGMAESLKMDQEAAEKAKKIAEKAAEDSRAARLERIQAEQEIVRKANEDFITKVIDLEKQISTIREQESVARNLRIQAQEQGKSAEMIQAAIDRENEITSQLAVTEASRQELLQQFADAEVIRAADTQKKLVDARKKSDAERLNQIKKAKADEFNIEKQTSQAQKQFDEQTYAQKVQTANAGLTALSSLLTAKNRQAFELGKAAAIAQAGIAIPLTAIEAYKSLAGIPLVGPALGIAAAAAATATGLSNIERIRSTKFTGFSEGGVVPGVGNKDTVPALLTPNEVVVPEKNFADLQASMVRGAVNDDLVMLMQANNNLTAKTLEQLTIGVVNEKLTTMISLLDSIRSNTYSLPSGSSNPVIDSPEAGIDRTATNASGAGARGEIIQAPNKRQSYNDGGK